MAKAIRFHQTGGPEVLRAQTVEVGEPGPGQARVRHSYVAVNFIDIYFRTGRYPLPLPNGLGSRRRRRRRGRRRRRHRHPAPATASATCSARRAPTRMCA